jgi:hypothetical protein
MKIVSATTRGMESGLWSTIVQDPEAAKTAIDKELENGSK